MEHLSMQVEPFSQLKAEALAAGLFERHWEDLALDKDAVPLAPNWQRYAELEGAGALSVVTVRQNGKIVGYSIMVVSTGLHYSTCLEATMDIFWLAPEVRGRMGGLRLFRAHEKELKRRGVQRIYAGSKLHKDSSRLFAALGYMPIERWFSKWIGG